MPHASNIFTGFRAIGFTSNHIPLSVRYHSKFKENYVVTSVGKAFHTYNCSRLVLTSVGNEHPEEISCLAVDAYLVFTGCGKTIRAYTGGRHVKHVYEGHDTTIHLLLPFAKHLISVDEDSQLKVWDINSEEVYSELGFDNATFRVSTLLHPSTYLNKVLLGSKQGSLQLWNIRTSKLIHGFSGWKTPVTALEQAPSVDVVAIGLGDGRVILHNIRYDETIMTFRQDWGPITAISFRTDGHPVMVTGSTLGHVALWNLQERKLQCQMRDIHNGAVTGMKCLQSEPLMVTSSVDNSVKVWIFDEPDGAGRLLRQRTGHSAPPNQIRFHGNNGQTILSAGQDSTLQSFSTVNDGLNKNLGRASYDRKKTKKTGLKYDKVMMPPITQFASEPSRQSDWDSIAACHCGLSVVTTWNSYKSSMGAHKLRHERFSNIHLKAIAECTTITSCGNFVLIGYSSGHVDKYNIQSGLLRGTYGMKEAPAHVGGVRGVAVDGLNQVTVTGGADSCVKFWHFGKLQLLETVKLSSQVARLRLHREATMLAVATDDFIVAIFDIETRKVVRRFLGHRNTITDMTFSPDARWLTTASMDATIRTWDLPKGCLIDCFLVDAPTTSIDMSPTGDFLITTHVDDLGIYLWSNMTLYKHVSPRPLPADYQPRLIDLPSTSRTSRGVREEESDEEEQDEMTGFKSPEQISAELVTLSLLSESRWKNLLSLDVIKQRNKPRQPPKVPKAAPFFLPTIPGLEPKFAPIQEENTDKSASKVMPHSLAPLSEFGQKLWKSAETKDFSPVLSHLKELGPSAVDVELRSLSPEGGGSVDLMAQFLTFIDHVLSTNSDFEITQAYLGLFVKLHGSEIAAQPVLVKEATKVQASQRHAWDRLQHLFNQNVCLVNYLRSATL